MFAVLKFHTLSIRLYIQRQLLYPQTVWVEQQPNPKLEFETSRF